MVILNIEDYQDWINFNKQECTVIDVYKNENKDIHLKFRCNKCNKECDRLWRSVKQSIKHNECMCINCNKNVNDFNHNREYLNNIYPQYELVDFYKVGKKIVYTIKCDKGHVFSMHKEYLSKSNGCKICYGNKKWTLDKVKEEFLKYNLELLNDAEYKNCYTPIHVRDSYGYIYKATVNKLKLYGDSFHKIKGNDYAIHNINVWCENNRPDYECVSQKYVSPRSLLLFKYNGSKIKPDKDRYFYCTYSAFVYDRVEHPYFTMSKGELKISEILSKENIKYEFQKTFKDLNSKYSKGHLRFDFYLPDYNTCIEYNGRQHYQVVDYFGGEKGFALQNERYLNKVDYCKNRQIKLIEIPYWDFNVMEQNLIKEIKG